MHKLTASRAAFIRTLVRQKKVRDAERAFIVEGRKPIGELLKSHATSFQALVLTEASLNESKGTIFDSIQKSGCSVYVCEERVFATLSDVTTPTGMLAILRRPVWNQDAVFHRGRLLGFYGESLQDPTNVGTIIRTALAFGLQALWLSPDSVDVFNPKVVRATAGALLSLPIFTATSGTLFVERDCAIVTAELPGPASIPLQDLSEIPPRSVVALGNESRGLSTSVLNLASLRFHIPIRPEAESLNVAASAAIAAFHFTHHV
jgi:TrmH family RNA methyltransferase